MDVAVPGLRAGTFAPAERGHDMADPQTVIGSVFGSGAIVAIITYGLSRIGAKKREDEAAYTARMTEAIAMRESDRARLGALEEWRDDAIKNMDDMRTDKIRLEGVIDALNRKNAADLVLLNEYEKNTIMYRTEIDDLRGIITAQKAELVIANERLEAIKAAYSRGEMTPSMLYQKSPEGTETAIITGAPGEII